MHKMGNISGVLLAEIWVLRRIVPGRTESFFAKPGGGPCQEEGCALCSESRMKIVPCPAAVRRRCGPLVPHHGDFGRRGVPREKIPSSRPFSQFPLTVEWDEVKAIASFKKHKVSFEEGKTIFNDPCLCTFPDNEHSADEGRYITTG
jgi:hypothetical protein